MLVAKLLFHFDTNLLNANQKIDEINQLEAWNEQEVILIVWSATSQNEALSSNHSRLAKKANTHIYTIADETDPENFINPVYADVMRIMEITEHSSRNQINDAKIVFEASKYGAILVTNDGASKSQPRGILGRRTELAKYVKIVTPTEAVELVKEKLVS